MVKTSLQLVVLSITHATEVGTRNHLYRVGFGKMVDTERVGVRYSVGRKHNSLHRPRKIGRVNLVLYLPDKGPLPYRVGSVWMMTVESNGKVILEER